MTTSGPTVSAKQDTPSREELITRADDLRSLLWEAAPEADRTRRVADKTFQAIRDAGLTRLLVPRRFDGYDSGMRTFLEVTIALGRGCGSSAWVTGVLNTGNWLAASYSDQAQADVWGENSAATTAGVLAPTAEAKVVDGGIVLTGKWGYASGSNHCDWVSVCYPGTSPDDPGMQLALVPVQDVTLEDTWFVSGMRATGSNTVVAHEVFVPAHRLRPLTPLFTGANATGGAGLSGRASLAGLLSLSLAGAQLGQAEAALDYVLEKAPKRSITTTVYGSQSESVGFQIDVAEASSMIIAAREITRQAADILDDYAAKAELPPETVRTQLRVNLAWAARQAFLAVDLLMSAHGSSAFAEVNPLQRIWRDAGIASRHAAFFRRVTQELHGKALLEKNPSAISFLV
ncbi:acyl-CoA dehydrogenase family protein [Amycolatopsis sp. NPDC047767]|uniref:acyl-CoA dehydrogenase family protein n=1 Tax=Amycolatopsis sp. NPDC047767 TaxID=3156765 RepID=UPI003454689E